MASILSLNPGDYVRAVVKSYHQSNPSRMYQNTYEFRANTITTDSTELEQLADRLAAFHQTIQHVDSVVHSVIMSTYEEEEGGYDPLSFITFPYGLLGIRGLTGQALPSRAVVWFSKQVFTGRPGKLHVRLVLNEADVEAPSGEWILTNPGAFQTEMGNALASSQLDDYLGAAGVSMSFQMVLISSWGDPPVLGHRRVLSIGVAGVKVTSTNHSHYNVL